MDHARFCRWVVFRGVPGINNIMIGAVAKRPLRVVTGKLSSYGRCAEMPQELGFPWFRVLKRDPFFLFRGGTQTIGTNNRPRPHLQNMPGDRARPTSLPRRTTPRSPSLPPASPPKSPPPSTGAPATPSKRSSASHTRPTALSATGGKTKPPRPRRRTRTASAPSPWPCSASPRLSPWTGCGPS